MPQEKYSATIPVGTLGIVALESSRTLGQKINDYIVQWRREREHEHASTIAFTGYERDNYLIEAQCPRFGTGEAKGLIRESVRGDDLYLLVDVCNYSLTYTVCGHKNRGGVRAPSYFLKSSFPLHMPRCNEKLRLYYEITVKIKPFTGGLFT